MNLYEYERAKSFTDLGPMAWKFSSFNILTKQKCERKVQGVPQSKAAAHPRHEEEEETEQNQTSANQTNIRKAQRLALSSLSEVIAMLC